VGSLAISGDKKQTRGGKGIKKPKKKEVTPSIKISKQQRTKRKMVTVINGLKTCDIDLKKASKQFATRFSCGSSVTGEDEIVIQGDVIDEALEYITDSWPEIDEDCITIVRGKK
jgi:density-regulated protein DRP1